jgi:opacity protein-like surface antigen
MLVMLQGVSFGDTTSTTIKGPYISSQLGAAILTDSDLTAPEGTGTIEFKPGYAVGLAGGYNFGMFRLEGEIGYQINDIDKVSACSGGYCGSGNASGNVTALSGLANVYIDFVNSSPVTPYISGGIGVARIDINDFKIEGTLIGDADDTVFAWQVGAGVAFAINQHFTIDLKYRYFATADLEFTDTKYTVASHNIYFGFRYNF